MQNCDFVRYFFMFVPQHQMEKVLSAKFEVEKFNRKNKFELWKHNMCDLLVQEGLHKVLAGKIKRPWGMTNEDWEYMEARSLNTIRLFLVDDVLFNIVGKNNNKLMEILYMTKYVTNQRQDIHVIVFSV